MVQDQQPSRTSSGLQSCASGSPKAPQIEHTPSSLQCSRINVCASGLGSFSPQSVQMLACSPETDCSSKCSHAVVTGGSVDSTDASPQAVNKNKSERIMQIKKKYCFISLSSLVYFIVSFLTTCIVSQNSQKVKR